MNLVKNIFIIMLIVITTFICSACFKNDKANMIRKKYNITQVIIIDKRSSLKKEITITDTDQLKLIKDTLLKIEGKKMKRELVGTFPNQTLDFDFPNPVFLLTITVTIKDEEYNYKIYGGQILPEYSPGTYHHVIGYRNDYKYIAKDDTKTGAYQSTVDGPAETFYTQFFI